MLSPREAVYPALYAAPEAPVAATSEYDADFITCMDQIVAYRTEGQGEFTPDVEAELIDTMVQGRALQTEITAVDTEIQNVGSLDDPREMAKLNTLVAKRHELNTARKVSEQARTTLFEGNMRFAYNLAQVSDHPDRTHIAFSALNEAINRHDPTKRWSLRETAKRIINQELKKSTNERAEQQKLAEQEPAPLVIPLSHLTYPNAAPEEADASGAGPDITHALSLAEFALDQTAIAPANAATSPQSKIFEQTVRYLLSNESNMSEAEREVIMRRYGLFGTPSETLDQIKATWGRSHERVRQIENKALIKLRIPARKNLLDGFQHADKMHPSEDDLHPSSATLTINGLVRTGRIQAIKTPKAAPEPKPDFTVPKYVPELPEGGRLERGTASYQRYSTMFNTRLGSMNSMKYHGTSTTKTPYPKEMLKQIEDDIGAYLTPQHIEDAWNTSMRHLITTATGDLATNTNNPFEITGTRLCQLFSALLIDRMRDDDHITVEIPSLFWGQWDDIGAWAQRGKITIIGEPGKNVGRNKRESAEIEVTSKGHWRPIGAF